MSVFHNCPNCGAALSAQALRQDVVTCDYCGTSFRLSHTPTPEPAMGDLLLAAKFDSNHMPGWEVLNQDKLTFHKGSPGEVRATFVDTEDKAYYVLRTSGLMDDYDASVNIRFLEGEKNMVRAGFYLRFSDDGGYAFLISVQSSFSYGIFEKDSAGVLKWKPLLAWSNHSAMRAGFGETNRLRVVCSGDSFRVYVNGVLSGSFRDGRFSMGKVYLTVDPGKGLKGGFAFSDLQLRSVPGA